MWDWQPVSLADAAEQMPSPSWKEATCLFLWYERQRKDSSHPEMLFRQGRGWSTQVWIHNHPCPWNIWGGGGLEKHQSTRCWGTNSQHITPLILLLKQLEIRIQQHPEGFRILSHLYNVSDNLPSRIGNKMLQFGMLQPTPFWSTIFFFLPECTILSPRVHNFVSTPTCQFSCWFFFYCMIHTLNMDANNRYWNFSQLFINKHAESHFVTLKISVWS